MVGRILGFFRKGHSSYLITTMLGDRNVSEFYLEFVFEPYADWFCKLSGCVLRSWR